jgi:hypothetical protein
MLPPQGNIATLRIVRKLRESLSFTEEEHKAIGLIFDPVNDKIQWNQENEKEGEKEIEIGEKAADIIKEALKKMNDQNQLREEIIPLWERFMEVKGEA